MRRATKATARAMVEMVVSLAMFMAMVIWSGEYCIFHGVDRGAV